MNRFVARVEVESKEVRVHVKNTGRCKELLVPGATVYLEDFTDRMGTRNLSYSLVAVEKGELLINMDSQAPNQVVKEALKNGTFCPPEFSRLKTVQPEKIYGSSRLDFYMEDEVGRKGFVEVKGVTLEEGGIVRFPDAPTQRGIKHIQELVKAAAEGYLAYVLFVIQMEGVLFFEPNDRTHPAFGEALRLAEKKGVRILAMDCQVTERGMKLGEPVTIKL